MMPSCQIKTDWESASSGWVPAQTWAWKNWESSSRQWRKEEPPTETEGQWITGHEWDLYGFEGKWEWKETEIRLPSVSLYYQTFISLQNGSNTRVTEESPDIHWKLRLMLLDWYETTFKLLSEWIVSMVLLFMKQKCIWSYTWPSITQNICALIEEWSLLIYNE